MEEVGEGFASPEINWMECTEDLKSVNCMTKEQLE